ncbi:MAG: hypothetical protein WAK71_19540 [Streptosporangiaceae bacterium]
MARSRGRREASGEEPNRVLGFPLRGALGGQVGQAGQSGTVSKSGQGDQGGGQTGQSARSDDESAAAQDSAQPQAGRDANASAASGNDAEPQRVLGIPLTWFTALGRKRSS